MKQCTKCRELKPLTNFYKQKGNKDGYRGYCKDCHNQYRRAYSRANRLKKRDYDRRWRAANIGKARLSCVIYYHSNKERLNRLRHQRRLADVSNIKSIRKRIRTRDNYTCQICGNKQTTRALDVHHITKFYSPKYKEESSAFSNLITLCHSCHGFVEGRLEWKPLLRKKALLNEQNFISKQSLISI